MSSPTNVELEDQISKAIEIIDDIDVSNFRANIDKFGQILEGEYFSQSAQATSSARSAMSGLLRTLDQLLTPILLSYAKLAGSQQKTNSELLDSVDGNLFQYFITNNRSVKSRNLTFGSPTKNGANVGDGLFYRLTTDRNSQAIENSSVNVKEFLCSQDAEIGSNVGEEFFNFTELTTDKDEVDWTSQGESGSLVLTGSENGIGRNMSFQELDGTADAASSLNSIPGWEVTNNINNFEQITTTPTPFASSPTEKINSKSYALKFKATDIITQSMQSVGEVLDSSTPYFLAIRWNRDTGLGTGTLKISMGTNSASVALVAQAGWQVLVLALNQNLWYDNFYQADSSIKIEWTKTGGTSMVIDSMSFGQMQKLGGSWYFAIPGSTNFKKTDKFTMTDTLGGVEGKVQYWFFRSFDSYLPHNNAGGETVTEPA